MAKTDETTRLERKIWYATNKMGTFGCFEVTIGYWGKERVDYITYDTKGTWRCYEIKVSKSDFYSKAKKTFIGHYNYYVLTDELYEQVKHDIPSHVGAYVGTTSVKRAKRQELKVDEQILKDSMIRSLSREFEKQFRSQDETEIQRMERRLRHIKSERDKYRNQFQELRMIGYQKYGRGWDRA